ncbi:uncharacterized protein METZ01_LOCUS14012 [marine metagenome]|uniref:Uncharacterized protein n=1 Tax=marine metagenome TaxID=408172 RepID=A0A381P4L0_9ZZZZ
MMVALLRDARFSVQGAVTAGNAR